MSTDLEFIGTQDATQRNFDRLGALAGLITSLQAAVPGLPGGVGQATEIQAGVTTITFSTNSTKTVTLAHGMAVTPTWAMAQSFAGGSLMFNVFVNGTGGYTSTNLDIYAQTYDGNNVSGTLKVNWVAIG